jgi:hypothetical protein
MSNFIDVQDSFNLSMGNVQALLMALSGDDNFTHMERDHVARLLTLTLESLRQLDKSFKDLVADNDSYEKPANDLLELQNG